MASTAAEEYDTWVANGEYLLKAVAVDNHNGASEDWAAVRVTSTVAQLYFIEVDHLNTPRLIENQSQQAMWRWDQQEPFGASLPDQNPTPGLGVFEFPLRFPGQYYDKEWNLAYNYFRDYDPAIGRYIQSDPIGLLAGLNTYSYVNSNPLTLVDPRGETPLTAGGAVIGTLIFPGPGTVIGMGLGLGLSYLIYQACTADTPDTRDCTKASEWQLRAAGITDEHSYKQDQVGKAGGAYDICACKDGSIVLRGVGKCGRSGPTITTGDNWK